VKKQRKDDKDVVERMREDEREDERERERQRETERDRKRTIAFLALLFAFERLHQVVLQSLLLRLVAQSLNTPLL